MAKRRNKVYILNYFFAHKAWEYPLSGCRPVDNERRKINLMVNCISADPGDPVGAIKNYEAFYKDVRNRNASKR